MLDSSMTSFALSMSLFVAAWNRSFVFGKEDQVAFGPYSMPDKAFLRICSVKSCSRPGNMKNIFTGFVRVYSRVNN